MRYFLGILAFFGLVSTAAAETDVLVLPYKIVGNTNPAACASYAIHYPDAGCGSKAVFIALEPGYTLQSYSFTTCPNVPHAKLDQHVVMSAIYYADEGIGFPYFGILVGDRLEGRVQIYCVRIVTAD